MIYKGKKDSVVEQYRLKHNTTMKLYVLFVILAFAEATNISQYSKNLTTFVGPFDISITKIPWMISVQSSSKHICSGIIISNDWVITAASCVQQQVDSSYKIRAGSSYYKSGGSLHTVEEIIIHEDFGPSKYGFFKHNIALIRINKPFKFDSTRRAAFLGEINSLSSYGSVHGWRQHKVLQEIRVSTALDEIICKQNSPNYEGIYDGQFCIRFHESSGIESTDVGSPVTNGYREISGIISWNNPEYPESQNHPIIATNIGAYRLWIKHHSGV